MFWDVDVRRLHQRVPERYRCVADHSLQSVSLTPAQLIISLSSPVCRCRGPHFCPTCTGITWSDWRRTPHRSFTAPMLQSRCRTRERCLRANVKLVLRLQTKKDRLDFADGSIEKKVYAYANLSYKKDLLVISILPSISEVRNRSLSILQLGYRLETQKS